MPLVSLSLSMLASQRQRYKSSCGLPVHGWLCCPYSTFYNVSAICNKLLWPSPVFQYISAPPEWFLEGMWKSEVFIPRSSEHHQHSATGMTCQLSAFIGSLEITVCRYKIPRNYVIRVVKNKSYLPRALQMGSQDMSLPQPSGNAGSCNILCSPQRDWTR